MGKEADILAKIVVVEDDVYMREELLNLLEKSGYDTIGLSDFENAVSEIAAYFPDLILLDINLPFRSGFEICKELKAKQIGTVLVLTARDKLQDELHALDLGADDYLTKPCNMSRLLARIKNLLRRKEEQVQQTIGNNMPYVNFIKSQSAQYLINISFFNWTYIICSIVFSLACVLFLVRRKK